jgi:hypothetical protein
MQAIPARWAKYRRRWLLRAAAAAAPAQCRRGLSFRCSSLETCGGRGAGRERSQISPQQLQGTIAPGSNRQRRHCPARSRGRPHPRQAPTPRAPCPDAARPRAPCTPQVRDLQQALALVNDNALLGLQEGAEVLLDHVSADLAA